MRKHRLKAKGLCQQGIIPDFYGVIERIDLQTLPPPWQPYPCAFLKDKLLPPPPNAVLIEYIPDMRRIDLSTFSEARGAKLCDPP